MTFSAITSYSTLSRCRSGSFRHWFPRCWFHLAAWFSYSGTHDGSKYLDRRCDWASDWWWPLFRRGCFHPHYSCHSCGREAARGTVSSTQSKLPISDQGRTWKADARSLEEDTLELRKGQVKRLHRST